MTHPPLVLLTSSISHRGSTHNQAANAPKLIASNCIANVLRREKSVTKVAYAFAVEIQSEMKSK